MVPQAAPRRAAESLRPTKYPESRKPLVPEPTALILIGVILFLASFSRAALGFGDALIAMPLLALVVPIKDLAGPLVALASALNAFLILVRDWRSLEFRQAAGVIGLALVGIPLGVWLLQKGDDRILKGVLGTVVLGFAVWSLRNPALPELKSRGWEVPFGLSAGLLGGAYNTAGPPLVIYAALKRWPPEVFRVILQTYFLPAGLLIVALHGYHGRMTQDVLKVFAMILPAIAVGFFTGRRLADRIPEERFRKIVYIVLLGLGTLLIFSAFQV